MNTTQPPLISIVLPVYNGAQTIATTVDSVLHQDFVDFELLVINDGSTDSTLDILASFNDSRIKIHDFKNRGLAASRNRGIHLAEGEYVAFIDADDLWTADKLAKQLAALKEDIENGMVYSLTDCIDENDQYLGHGSHIIDSGHIYNHLLIWNFLDNGSNPLIRKHVLEEVGPFDETLAAAEDWDIWLRIAYKYKVACVPEPQILYRIHSNAMSSNIKQQEAASFRVLEKAVQRLPEGARRDDLEMQGSANLNRYFAGRLISTAADPRAILPAFGYLWRWVSRTSDRPTVLWKATTQLVRAVVLTLLPHSIARPLLARLKRSRNYIGMVWKSD